MYRVIKGFTDLKDNNHEYKENDYYPHAGRNIEDIPKERIDELSTKNNKRGEILIEEIKETKQQEVTTEVDEEVVEETKETAKEVEPQEEVSETKKEDADEVKEEVTAEVEKEEKAKSKKSNNKK